MTDLWSELGFRPADILIPAGCDMSKWSVVACDQFTSQPDYWDRVEEFVGDAPTPKSASKRSTARWTSIWTAVCSPVTPTA